VDSHQADEKDAFADACAISESRKGHHPGVRGMEWIDLSSTPYTPSHIRHQGRMAILGTCLDVASGFSSLIVGGDSPLKGRAKRGPEKEGRGKLSPLDFR